MKQLDLHLIQIMQIYWLCPKLNMGHNASCLQRPEKMASIVIQIYGIKYFFQTWSGHLIEL